MSGPYPPADLDRRNPELVELPAGGSLHRFYPADLDPIFFDTSKTGRFNAPDASFGVLYAGKEIAGAFAETFLRTPGRTLMDPDLLQRKAYVRLTTRKALTLIRFAGPGLARLGATAEVSHAGLPYDVPQAWSQALRQHPVDADGIFEILTCAERTSCSTDHQASDLSIGRQIYKRSFQFNKHRGADTVETVRPIERQPRYVAIDLKPDDRFVFHAIGSG